MGAAAAKRGAPMPAQGGKAQPTKPTLAPAQGSTLPPQGGKAQPTNTLPAPGQAGTVPPQGGKAQNPDGTYTGNLGIPPQGGKSQAEIDKFNADMNARKMGQLPTPTSQFGLGLGDMLYGGGGQQPTTTTPSNLPGYAQPLVPAQGGKSGGPGGSPEQLAALQAQLDASRPVPQVQQPAPVMPAPQVQQPAPAPIAGLGLAALRNKPMPILKGRR